MTWPEVDIAAREWVIPAARSKNGEPHVVPLSDQAVAVLEAVPRIKGKANYVFTTDGEHPVSGFSRMKKRIDKLMAGYAAEIEATIPAWTIHDIRRTVAAGMQRIGIKIEVTEKVLNHKSGSFRGIAGIYQVHDYADEKRAALEAWGRFRKRCGRRRARAMCFNCGGLRNDRLGRRKRRRLLPDASD